MTWTSGNAGAPDAPLGRAPRVGALAAAMATHWWTLVLRGVIAIIFAIMAFVSPVAVMFSLALLFGAYLLVDGVLGLFAALSMSHEDRHWWWLLAEALFTLVMGGLALAFPGGAVLAFAVAVAIWALLSGFSLLAASFRFDLAEGRLWLAIGGLVSILWGVLLLAAPLTGAVVLTWWLGAYTVLFGVMLIAAGFKLRSLRGRVQQATRSSQLR